MNFRPLLACLPTLLALIAFAQAVKVDLPGQAERESTHIVTGTVTAIYSRVVRDAA